MFKVPFHEKKRIYKKPKNLVKTTQINSLILDERAKYIITQLCYFLK